MLSQRQKLYLMQESKKHRFVSHLVRPRFPVSPNLLFRKLKGIRKFEHINCDLTGENEGLKEMKHVAMQYNFY